MKLLDSLLQTGVRDEMSYTLKKQLVLTNRLAVLSVPIISLLAVIDGMSRGGGASAFIDILFFFLFGGVFVLNYFNKTLLSRILLCTGLPLALLAGNIALKTTFDTPVYLEQFVTDRYYLLICAALPPLLLDLAEEKKSFITVSIFCLAALLALDPLNLYFGYSVFDGFNAPERNAYFLHEYYMLNVFLAAAWLMLFFSVVFLKNMNQRFEKNLSRIGIKLEGRSKKIDQKNTEIQVHNEELQQQQEELIAQRDFIESQNEELKSVHHKIQKSVHAARHIQKSIMPTPEDMEAAGEYFKIFRPKNVVSGDYYWVYRDGHNIFLAAADCTGHGVPGAFMTMIAATQLEKIVRVQKVISPGEVLEKLVVDFRQVLRQEETGNRDGMDIALLRLTNNESGKILVSFAGAKMCARFFDLEGNCTELKGERFSVGRSAAGKSFSEHQTVVLPGSMLYLHTDGLSNQNNSEGGKYSEERLKSLYAQYYAESCDQQKELFIADFEAFRENTPLRDDVMLLGIRLKLPYS